MSVAHPRPTDRHAAVRVGDSGAVEWPGEIDLDPENLYGLFEPPPARPWSSHRARAHPGFPLTLPPYDITDLRIDRHGVLDLTFVDSPDAEVGQRERLSGPSASGSGHPEGFHEALLREALLRDWILCWPGEVDFAPETLHQRVRTGVWPEALPA